jgi:outer membrane protein assembly factor BamD (BamD/ComL family)
MKSIAQAELLFYQNKSHEALLILKDIESKFPHSKLIDDILMIEAEEANRTKQYDLAISLYSRVIEQFPSSILADKALYSRCILQETILKDSVNAMDGYLMLLTNYKDSVYVTDARKRLRKLRGEKEIES